jgi:hypothetical protein
MRPYVRLQRDKNGRGMLLGTTRPRVPGNHEHLSMPSSPRFRQADSVNDVCSHMPSRRSSIYS